MRLHAIASVSLVLVLGGYGFGAGQVEILESTGGIPAHVAGTFTAPLAFQQAESGEYLVFDQRAHTVYVVDRQATRARRLVQIGQEQGNIIEPRAFDMEPGGTFVVADGPNGRERLQIFGLSGNRLGGFTLPGRNTARVTLGKLVLNGVGSVQYTGRSILINQPETGALITEYGLGGSAVRTIGTLRTTGHEDDREVHLALNTGLPLVDPRGGLYFVFQTGRPLFRRYDAAGNLVFERHIEGRELDDILARQPTVWPKREGGTRELPLIPPVIRTAEVDPSGRLWVTLVRPFTYVYDEDGDKERVVQFRAAGLIAPTSLSFAGPDRILVTPGCYEFEIP